MIRLLTIAVLVLSGFSSVAQADNVHGAIAFSQRTGIDGYSYNYPSRHAAERRALRNCRAAAGDCAVVVNFYNACGALAVGRGNGYGVAWAPNRYQAQNKAMAACRAYTSRCRIQRWVCSGHY
jgi:serine/threonine-protein kinase